MSFIELPVRNDELDSSVQLINTSYIGRVYANPQSNRSCIIELSYQSINDAPVFLEVELSYEVMREKLKNL